MNSKIISVEILFGNSPTHIFEEKVRVMEGSTIKQAIEKSHLKDFYPNLDLKEMGYAIYSKPVELDYSLREHDRIEILRNLIADPKELRLIKAARQEELKNKNKQH